jgi:hypothetical protein
MDPGETDELLPEVLAICEDFFAGTSPAVHHELDTLLRARDITGGPGWLIDMLALTRLRLQSPSDQSPTSDGGAVKTHGY